jgi:hypothetical protein
LTGRAASERVWFSDEHPTVRTIINKVSGRRDDLTVEHPMAGDSSKCELRGFLTLVYIRYVPASACAIRCVHCMLLLQHLRADNLDHADCAESRGDLLALQIPLTR